MQLANACINRSFTFTKTQLENADAYRSFIFTKTQLAIADVNKPLTVRYEKGNYSDQVN